jgi:DNA topoisomerase-2
MISFYSIQEFQKWLKENENASGSANESGEGDKKWIGTSNMVVKYYKGLGTNTAAEGKEYFRDLSKHCKPFIYEDSIDANGSVKKTLEDAQDEPADNDSSLSKNAITVSKRAKHSKTDDLIDMVFNIKRAEDRKKWLFRAFDPNSYLDPKSSEVTYLDFINKELIHFSIADNVRSIPSVIGNITVT